MTDQQKMDFDQSVTTIEVMLRKERTKYNAPDYLRHLPASIFGDRPVDPKAHDAIATWFVKIAELCDFSLETASIAISILDRFAATPDAKDIIISRDKFSLASLTAIYTAVKIHEQKALSPAFVAKLSGGLNSKEDIERMEFRMLKALGWQVNPPTAMWFVRNFFELITDDVFDESSRKLIMDLVQFQVHFSMINYDFCKEYASDIALASLLNAVEDGDCLCPKKLKAFLCQATNIKSDSLESLRVRLCGAPYHEAASELLKEQKRSSCSPICTESRNEMLYQNSPKSVTARS